MSFFLGIDAGGTRTRCALGDGRRTLGSGFGAGANIVRVGADQARDSIHTAVHRACAEARVSPQCIQRTCIGAAGISSPGVIGLLRQFVSEMVSGDVDVLSDHEIAFAAALGELPGVLVIAGTGSVAFARNDGGQEARAGGYGFAISDEGSGQWIGRTAVSQILRALDRGTTTALHHALLEAWGIDAGTLVKAANATPPPNFAALCPVVVKTADRGDAVAIKVLQQAGTELAQLAAVVLDRLWATDEPVPVAMVGGVFQHSSVVREGFALSLRQSHPLVQLQKSVADPVVGALSLAGRGTPQNRT